MRLQEGDVIEFLKPFFVEPDETGFDLLIDRDRKSEVSVKDRLEGSFVITEADSEYEWDNLRCKNLRWRVNARRLKENGEYDPNGQDITFYQNAWNYTGSLGPDEFKVIGKMERTYVPKTR